MRHEHMNGGHIAYYPPYAQNPYGNVREIVTLLPEFNPSSDKSLMPNQFIKRNDMLRTTYRWDDQTLVFAVQQKLQGYTKYWVNSQDVFLSWTEFATKFLKDFASTENIADVYFKMSQTKRQFNESPQEYYYKMISIGTRGNVPENAIARYIINGINEPRLKQKISNEYTLCNELLRDINIYTVYNDVQNFNEKPKPKYPVNTNHDLRDNSKIQTLHNKESETTRKVKCFNCSRIGHYSNKCPEPQRKERCSICNRTTHKETDCPSKKNNAENKQTVNKIENPGSAYTLIRETFAKDFKNEILRCSVTLSGFADGKFICTSKINAVVDFDNNEFITDLLIVDDGKTSENILLGRDVLCREGKRLIIEGDKCHIEDLQTSVEIPSDVRKQLKGLLSTYRGVFAESMSELGKCVINKMSFKVSTDVPIREKPYRIAFAKRKIVSDIVLDLLKNDIIRPSSSPYASSVVLVEKKNGEHRLCVDYRALNKIIIKNPYPMPNMEEQFAQLSGNRFFTTLDLRMGYHQIEIEESSKQYTAFVTTDGHFEYNRMPFGMVNAPGVFQETMDKIASSMGRGEVLIYLDDVIIPSKSIEEGIERLEKFLCLLKEQFDAKDVQM
ncbi:uncharacterized protein K02A2.6-like [Teleopsis dalmanni]|uniref:uncharacterized protein K02A2.6-like n=1 Tax=Teleopsis dalmanni TaxID=139649 RepID=UPI0018CD3CD2|nr:uncharacterized protein K02A2.6-like [Teleopsis dalmanni]